MAEKLAVFGRGVKQGKTGEKGARRFGSCAPGCHGPNVETVGYYRESLPSAEAVAQVSKPAVSRVSKPANRCQYQARRRIPRRADLEVGDTAGLETCATYEADPGARTLSMHFLLPAINDDCFAPSRSMCKREKSVLSSQRASWFRTPYNTSNRPPAALRSAEAVAQVSKPAVSRVSKPANRCQYQARRRIPRSADLEVGDTAGLETCATYEADPGARTLSIHFPKGPAPARTPCYPAFASETVRFPGTGRAEKLPAQPRRFLLLGDLRGS